MHGYAGALVGCPPGTIVLMRGEHATELYTIEVCQKKCKQKKREEACVAKEEPSPRLKPCFREILGPKDDVVRALPETRKVRHSGLSIVRGLRQKIEDYKSIDREMPKKNRTSVVSRFPMNVSQSEGRRPTRRRSAEE